MGAEAFSDREEGGSPVFVAVRPQAVAVCSVEELNRSANPFIINSDTAFNNRFHLQITSDLPWIMSIAAIAECRGSGDDAQSWRSGEQMNQLFCQAVSEMRVAFAAISDNKWKDGNRRLIGI